MPAHKYMTETVKKFQNISKLREWVDVRRPPVNQANGRMLKNGGDASHKVSRVVRYVAAPMAIV